MQHQTHALLIACMLIAMACGSCSKPEAVGPAEAQTPVGAPDHPGAAPETTHAEGYSSAAGHSGTVAETMNAASYTYVLLDTGTEKIWFAGPACVVKAGDKLTLPGGMLKENFTSKTLNRTFEKIYFLESIMAPEGKPAVCSMPASQSMAGSPPAPLEGSSRAAAPGAAGFDFSGITKPAGGKTVAEIHAGKKACAGKPVKLRGKVVKFNADIMGKNWVHVQDGTGEAGANDLTVTTLGTAKVGDLVLIEGVVALEKDFGYGYRYAVLIDNATLKTE